jgi:hypothetical protein
MPYNWVRVHSSPAPKRRDDIKQKCRRHGARLCENQTFYDEDSGKAWALIEMPADESKWEALHQDLEVLGWVGLVDADEKGAGKHPPPSRPPGGGSIEIVMRETTIEISTDDEDGQAES